MCGDGDETINHILSKCNKLAQRAYKTRYVWVGMGIHWELCKKFKYEKAVYTQLEIHPRDWDAHNSLGFWDKNESSNLGQTTRASDSQQKNVNLLNIGLYHPVRPQGKNEESETRDKYLDW